MSAYATPTCPADAAHGRLVDWASERSAFYCPARAHEGANPFYTSDLVPAPRPARESAPLLARGPRRRKATERAEAR